MGRQVTAAAVLLALAFMFTMGTPGFDFMGDDYNDPASKAAIREEYPIWGRVVIALYRLNREVRWPIMRAIRPLERPLRVTQDWNLFRDGPSRVRRLEIYVDGELRHRSADPGRAWLSPQLRNRHIRPLCEAAARKPDAPDWPGLVRLVAEHAQADFPGAREVVVLATSSRFPGVDPEVRHGWRAVAPDWTPERIPEPGE